MEDEIDFIEAGGYHFLAVPGRGLLRVLEAFGKHGEPLIVGCPCPECAAYLFCSDDVGGLHPVYLQEFQPTRLQ